MTPNKERRRIYLERKEGGCCPRCGIKLKKSVKTIYCEDCKNYFSKYNAEHTETINEKRRNRHEERKSLKRCPRCGRYLGKKYSKILCVSCLEKMYIYNNRKKRTKKDKKNKTKRQNGRKHA